MKKTGLNLLSLLFAVIIAGVFNTCLIAQSVPMGINYQAVARDANGDELVNRNIDVRLSIISGSPAGEVELEEVHSEVTTSQFGLFNIVIGQGIYSNGTVPSFEDIPWGDNLHFLKVEIKFDSEYLTMGTMQFLSVPYALYAQKSLEPGPQGQQGPAGDPATDDQVLSYDPQTHILSLENDDNPVDLSGLINDADADTDNELQILNLSGNKLQIKTLSDSTLINSVDIDASPVNEIQNLSIQGRQLSLSLGNSVSLPDSVNDDDADPLNEIQDLHIEGNILYITRNSDSTRIDLSPYLDNTDEQDITLTQNLLSIENGSTVALNYNDTSSTNELQVLSISNDTIYLTNGGYVKLPQDNVDDADTDPANEIQDLSFTDNILKVTNNSAATDIDLSGYLDNTDQQDLNFENNLLTIENGTTTVNLSSLENIPLTGFKYRNDVGSGPITGPDTVDITFNIEELNFGDDFDGTAFTAPEDGVYSFYVTLDSESGILRAVHNDQEVGYFSDQRSFSFILYLVAGEQVKIQFSIESISFGSYSPCSFTGFRIH